MLEWHDLTEGPAPLLERVDRAARPRPVQHAWLARELTSCGPDRPGPADGALVVAAADAECLAPGRVAGLGTAAGVVVVGDRAAAERVADALAGPGVAVCLPAVRIGPVGAPEMWGLLLERLAAARAVRDARSGALAALVVAAAEGAGTAAAEDGPERLTAWCARELGATVRVLGPDADLASFGPDGEEVAALAQGRARGPVRLAGAVAVAAGRRFPRPVLVASRTAPWHADELLLLEQAAACAGLLSWAAEVAARDARLTTASRGLKVAALQQLMAGDLVRAGRTVEPLVPGLVAAGAGAVAVVECAPGETRSALALAVDRAVRSRALTVLCPVSDQQVIVVHPADAGRLDEILAPVVAHVRGRAAGISAVTPWPRTAAAYEGAVAALAAARGTSARLAVHDGRAPLSDVLGPDARAWALRLIGPFTAGDDLPHLAQETLWWGESAAARLLGRHRHTLARRLDGLAARAGLDRADPWHRTALYLAVRLAGSAREHPAGGRAGEDGPHPEGRAPDQNPERELDRVLDHADARAWARQVLDPLPGPLRRTLAVWVEQGMRPDEATAVLGLSRSTLYKRLARAAELTHLEFTRYPGPAAEAALALHIAGDLRLPPLPAPGAVGDPPLPQG